jgi:hypothetical protein
MKLEIKINITAVLTSGMSPIPNLVKFSQTLELVARPTSQKSVPIMTTVMRIMNHVSKEP